MAGIVLIDVASFVAIDGHAASGRGWQIPLMTVASGSDDDSTPLTAAPNKAGNTHVDEHRPHPGQSCR